MSNATLMRKRSHHRARSNVVRTIQTKPALTLPGVDPPRGAHSRHVTTARTCYASFASVSIHQLRRRPMQIIDTGTPLRPPRIAGCLTGGRDGTCTARCVPRESVPVRRGRDAAHARGSCIQQISFPDRLQPGHRTRAAPRREPTCRGTRASAASAVCRTHAPPEMGLPEDPSKAQREHSEIT